MSICKLLAIWWRIWWMELDSFYAWSTQGMKILRYVKIWKYGWSKFQTENNGRRTKYLRGRRRWVERPSRGRIGEGMNCRMQEHHEIRSKIGGRLVMGRKRLLCFYLIYHWYIQLISPLKPFWSTLIYALLN